MDTAAKEGKSTREELRLAEPGVLLHAGRTAGLHSCVLRRNRRRCVRRASGTARQSLRQRIERQSTSRSASRPLFVTPFCFQERQHERANDNKTGISDEVRPKRA